MRKNLMTAAFALGLLLSGIGIGQAFTMVSVVPIRNATPTELEGIASQLMDDYNETVKRANGSAVAVTQVASETNVRLQYVQVRQNAEIMRLLKQIAGK